MNVNIKKIDTLQDIAKLTPKHSSSYLAYLDGLRAFAIIAVLLFHGDNNWLHGGFLGVEIFFVISGFIISKLLFDELNKTGRVDLGRFWIRRLRRLLPAAFAMMISTWICVLLLFPDEINQISEDLPYGFSFLNNWNYIINERSYFELIGRPRLFEHLWSLGIEFQFYVAWALICCLLFKQPRWFATVAIIYMALYSTCQMLALYTPNEDPSRVYFGTDTRASALLVGALLALLLQKFKEPLSYAQCQLTNVLGIFSIVGLILFCVYAKSTDSALFQGGFLCVSLLTAIVIGSCLLMSKQNHSSVILSILSSNILSVIGINTDNT
jgi:peptidoglycan/LPS O-acetylase OafA/YrhL